MKRLTTLLLFVAFLSTIASAQYQLENVSFEQWEVILVSNADTTREPIDWSSLKTSDDPSLIKYAPVVCTRSSDAHTGKYSIELTNIQSLIVANGVATNGRLHPNINTDLAYIYTDTEDSQWNTPFTGRPDSIAGWIKYFPKENDTLQIKVTLHTGFAKQPDPDYTENWIANAEYKSPLDNEGGWVRFSTPFTYFKETIPEYVLVTLNSGNGFFPVANSRLLVDDLEMIYNTPQSNAGWMKQTEGYLYAIGKNQLIVKGMDPSLFHTIDVFDITGKLLWSDVLTSDQVDIAPAHRDNGLYIIKLKGKNTLFTQKVMLR